MKHIPSKPPPPGEEEEEQQEVCPPPPGPTLMADLTDTTTSGAAFDPTADICSQLMQRYSSSGAAHHRHLIASAAAMKSIILDESLPLSPLSYFAASITALSSQNDAAFSAAISTLLSIVLPLVPEGSITADKAREAVGILVGVLDGEKASTSSAKCLGILLGFCDLRDWDLVKLPFETLLNCSIHKRPKVRKCALIYLENALRSFQFGTVKKKASKLILSLLESCMTLAAKSGALRTGHVSETVRQPEAEHSGVVHVMNVVKVTLPRLSDKISVKVVLKLVELLYAQFSAFTMLILNAIKAFLDEVEVEVEVVTEVAQDIIHALLLYVSSKNNPKDSVISSVNLLKSALDKIHSVDSCKWSKNLPAVINAITGLLTCEDDVASQASITLKILIDQQLPGSESQPSGEGVGIEAETCAIASVCSAFTDLLDACVATPNEHILAVLSVLFLKLGGNSFFHMRNIVLKLAEFFIHADGFASDTHHLQKCFGCAVIAMGPENILSLVPISFSMENFTCSNMWLLPILKKYIYGASLGYFMEHIVPLAESLQRASRKVKKSVIGQDLQAHARGLWGLFPAFCRNPTDLSQSFQFFAKVMLHRLEKDTSMHEDIAVALQELVNQNKCLPKSAAAPSEPIKHSSSLLEDYLLEKRRSHCHSRKITSRNVRALSSYSHELFQALMVTFLASPPESRASLKNAISCLASILDSSVTKKIFISSLERFSMVKSVVESGEFDSSNASADDMTCHSSSKSNDSQWCLILDLASSVVPGANEDLVGLVFRLTKHAFKAGDGMGVCEAYNTLSCVLEEHACFCSSKMDELVDLLLGMKTADVACLGYRLSSLHILLVHALKGSSDVDNTKPFLILNEIILLLKDSKEEARKTAYDVLLRLSSSLGGSSAANPDGPYHRLISMILGYLSGPSPHITSAAISALSVLVFKEPELCLAVPDVVPSVVSLLQTKAVEVIKAVLGFIKVLVSCLRANDLQNFLPSILDGLLPWSSISRHHFRSKVTVILEIIIRKCGFPAVKLVTPEKYQTFIKKVSLSRHGKTISKEADSTNAKPQLSDSSINGKNKRPRNETGKEENTSFLHKRKRRKQKQDPHSFGGAKTNQTRDKRSRIGDSPGKFKNKKRENLGKHNRRNMEQRKAGKGGEADDSTKGVKRWQLGGKHKRKRT